MKTRALIIIGISITIFLLTAVVYPTINYKTWGNNELHYTPFSVGTKIVCDEWLWQPPQNCRHVSTVTDTNRDSEIIQEDAQLQEPSTSSVSINPPSGMSQDEREQLQIKKIEHYEIEIIGLKDKYKIGETYSFYFIISGYGYACANYDAKYPDENGNTIGMGVEVLCDAQQRMTEFEINQAEIKGTLGNIGIHTSGTYTVTVTFEKPNQYFPTSVSKTFEVVE